MRFFHRITLALALICLFGHSGFVSSGAPTTGKYAWVECRPDGNNANCVTQMGPVVPLKGKSPRLPPSSVKEISQVTTEEGTFEMEEQSGEGSGNLDTRIPVHGPEQEVNKNKKEGITSEIEASGELDYSNFVFPEEKNEIPVADISAADLKKENMIP